MQINTIGFAGLLGAGGANAAAPAAGGDLGQAFGLLLGAPTDPAGAGMTPPLAANDPAAPAAPTPSLSMAQLLTTAAPLATGMAAAMPAATPLTDVQAPQPPLAKQPGVQPQVTQPQVTQPQPSGETPALPEDPALPAPATPAAPGKPAGTVPAVDAKPAKAAPKPQPGADAATEMRAGQPADAPVETAPEQPVEDSKTPTPVKRGPRLATVESEELPTQADAAAMPVTADAAALAVQQAPVRPELAVRPQPSPTRVIGEVSTGGRKTDAARGTPDVGAAKGAESIAAGSKTDTAVSAIAGKSGEKNDNAPSDDRGQAPAFTLRQDAHAAPAAHAATETMRTAATPVAAAAEPVIAARPGHLGQTMGVEIARKVEAGEDTLRVRLSPENLGKVEVTLAFDEGGTLRATVRAESQQALDLLRQDAPDLGRALDQAGVRADSQSFRFESRAGDSGAQSQQQSQNQNRSGGQFAGKDEPEATQPVYRAIRGDGQVDLLA